ncbi:MAG: ABC transporter substrate-binding protein [Lautropia mirabilis]|nr:ABC transporter substrate-binding protein [Lautropia mirabilis]
MAKTVSFSKTVLAAVVAALSMGAAQAAQKEVTDVQGRKVKIESPAKRVLLGFYFEDYMAVGTEKAFDKVVGISREAWEGWRPANWALHTAHRPSLKELPDVGEVEVQSFSVEKTLALRPDVIVLAKWQYLGLGPDVDRLEQSGIPIVVVDYNDQDLKNHVASTLLLGEITGQQARAKKIANEYKEAVETITRRIAKAGKAKPKVYVEFGNKGPSEYSFSYGKNMWGPMITTAGGENIAAPFVEYWGPLNPEQIIASRPDVILISGTESKKNPNAMLMGEGVDKAEAQKRLEGYAKRPGWGSLPAIKDKRIYGVYQGASRSITDYPSIQYIAKVAYPELFKDLDPQANYISFYKRYLPVTPSGTFYTDLKDAK